MPGVWKDVCWVNNRPMAERAMRDSSPEVADFRSSLYKREKYVKFCPGTVLMYRQDVWHRGTPLKAGTCRRSANITIIKKSARGRIGHWERGWATEAYRLDQSLQKLVCKLSPTTQRPGLGIPPPASDFWDEMQIRAAVARYGEYGWDPEPYLRHREKRRQKKRASICYMLGSVAVLGYGIVRVLRSIRHHGLA